MLRPRSPPRIQPLSYTAIKSVYVAYQASGAIPDESSQGKRSWRPLGESLVRIEGRG